MHLFAHFSRFCAVIGGIMGKNIAVLASGSGTNAENIIRYFREKGSARVALVLTNRQNAFVLERAKGLGVPCAWFAKSDWESGEPVLSMLREYDIDLWYWQDSWHVCRTIFCMLIPIK